MKLATAYIEIAARTDEFRRQLRDARQMATDAAAAIQASFHEAPLRTPRDRTSNAKHESSGAVSAASPREGAHTGAEATDGGFPPLGRISPPDGSGAAASPSRGAPGGHSSEAESTQLLRQHLELARRELDVLNKQLEALRELRQGVPAVLT